MNQSELAARMKCHRSVISRILSGSRNASREMSHRLRREVEGTTILDWLFAKQNANKLVKAVRRAE